MILRHFPVLEKRMLGIIMLCEAIKIIPREICLENLEKLSWGRTI